MYDHYYNQHLNSISPNTSMKTKLARQLFAAKQSRPSLLTRFFPAMASLGGAVAVVAIVAVTFFAPDTPITIDALVAKAQELPKLGGQSVLYVKTLSAFRPTQQQENHPYAGPDTFTEEFWTNGKDYEQQRSLEPGHRYSSMTLKHADDDYSTYAYDSDMPTFRPGTQEQINAISVLRSTTPLGSADPTKSSDTIGSSIDGLSSSTSTPLISYKGSDEAIVLNSWFANFVQTITMFEEQQADLEKLPELKEGDVVVSPMTDHITSVNKPHIAGEETINGVEAYVIEASVEYGGDYPMRLEYRGWISKEDQHFVKETMNDNFGISERTYVTYEVRTDPMYENWFDASAWKERLGIAGYEEVELKASTGGLILKIEAEDAQDPNGANPDSEPQNVIIVGPPDQTSPSTN